MEPGSFIGTVRLVNRDKEEKLLYDCIEMLAGINRSNPQRYHLFLSGNVKAGKSSMLSHIAWLKEGAYEEYRDLKRFKATSSAISAFFRSHSIEHSLLQPSDKIKEIVRKISSEFSQDQNLAPSILLSSDEIEEIASRISSGSSQSHHVALLFLQKSDKTKDMVINRSVIDILPTNINEKIKNVKRRLKCLRKLISLIIRLQYIARETHNRISDSPTPIKKEPPIGGIKVGGKQHAFRHAA